MSLDTIIDVHKRSGGAAAEFYITARPKWQADAPALATALMERVGAVLAENSACILQERLFADAAGMEALVTARASVLKSFADGVEPTCLIVPPNMHGPICGVQVHAMAGPTKPKVLSVGGRPCARLVNMGDWSYLVGCDLQADAPAEPDREAAAMLEKTEAVLSQVGGTLHDIARTWMWLGGILSWYGPFNRVRNDLFKSRGLLKDGGAGRMPASTGIGIGPAPRPGRRHCTMDFCAMLGARRPEFLLACGNQDAASKYNSAFSRASVAHTPGGRTVYVSGTAAIDAAGVTTHIGDTLGQIEDTVANVRAVLRNASCSMDNIVSAIAYCKTPEVERTFRYACGTLLRGPVLVTVADVCRDNLLFELEATAMA